jgi:cytochrome c oxidase cbb3-type subunit III
MMRTTIFVLGALLPLLMTACRNRSDSTAVGSGGPAIVSDPVGPVPGAVSNVVYRSNPYSNDPVALQDGRRLFNWYNCSGCHGGHAGGGMGPSLRDPVWLYGNRDDQIFDSIAHGRSKGMPAWGTKIPEDQIWQLVAYIKSMGTPQEPDPPVEPVDEEVENPQENTVLGVGTQTRIAGRR